jgi:hypothetical protein
MSEGDASPAAPHDLRSPEFVLALTANDQPFDD